MPNSGATYKKRFKYYKVLILLGGDYTEEPFIFDFTAEEILDMTDEEVERIKTDHPEETDRLRKEANMICLAYGLGGTDGYIADFAKWVHGKAPHHVAEVQIAALTRLCKAGVLGPSCEECRASMDNLGLDLVVTETDDFDDALDMYR